MEQIDDCCHRFERLRQQRHHQHMCTIRQSDPHVSTVAFQSLDTVRALHQTVVSLRKALEEAHREIDTLKKRITVNEDIEEGKKYREQQQLDTSNENLLNLPLNIDLGNASVNATDTDDQKAFDCTKQVQSNRSTSTNLNDNENNTTDVPHTHRSTKSLNLNEAATSSSRKAATITKQSTEHFEHHVATYDNQQLVLPIKADIKVRKTDINRAETSVVLPTQRLPQMASKIDVKIKLTSNFKIDGSESSSETTGSNSGMFLFIFHNINHYSFFGDDTVQSGTISDNSPQ